MVSKLLCEGCRKDISCNECIVFFAKQKEMILKNLESDKKDKN